MKRDLHRPQVVHRGATSDAVCHIYTEGVAMAKAYDETMLHCGASGPYHVKRILGPCHSKNGVASRSRGWRAAASQEIVTFCYKNCNNCYRKCNVSE